MLTLQFFGFLVTGLLLAKIALVFYRISTRKWPASLHFLWQIINWRIEAIKILMLLLASFVLSLLLSSIG